MLALALTYYQARSTPANPWGWVADTRQMSAIPKDMQHWLTTEWIPAPLPGRPATDERSSLRERLRTAGGSPLCPGYASATPALRASS